METNKLHPLEPEQCKQLNRPADNSAFLEGLKKIRDMEKNKEIEKAHQDLRDMIMELIAAEKRKGPEPSKLYLEALDDTLSAIDTYFGV